MMETRNTSTAETKCSPDDVIRIKTTIVENFRELIARGPDERLCWTGTQCDLIELAHIVWETGSLRDKRGLPMGFRTIVERICTSSTVLCPETHRPSLGGFALARTFVSVPCSNAISTCSPASRSPLPCGSTSVTVDKLTGMAAIVLPPCPSLFSSRFRRPRLSCSCHRFSKSPCAIGEELTLPVRWLAERVGICGKPISLSPALTICRVN